MLSLKRDYQGVACLSRFIKHKSLARAFFVFETSFCPPLVSYLAVNVFIWSLVSELYHDKNLHH